jgi:3',5'-cyclic AMP phosphodiesterase CpdA
MKYILHVSDLHFGNVDQAQLWSNQLAQDLRHELQVSSLNLLILSGDIANYSTSEEYEAAQQFLKNLGQEFDLTSKQIIIVPGNHDLNWGIAEEAYQLLDRKKVNGELIEGHYIPESERIIWLRDEDAYQQRFAHFRDFYQAIKGQPYPLDYDQQYTLAHFPEHNLLVLGLNSAWELDHHYRTRASIHMGALSQALTEIRRTPAYQSCLKVAVWHHPFKSRYEDRIKDDSFLGQLAVAGFSLFFHGHIHQAQTDFYSYDTSPDGRKLHRVCAGTFGASTKELETATPWQYNLLNWEGAQITVQTRKRESENGPWESDPRWRQGPGKPSLDSYTISLQEEVSQPEKKKSPLLQGHYKMVLRAISCNDIVPFIGADINLCDRTPEANHAPNLWKPEGLYPPSNDELAAYLDQQCGYPYLEDLQCPLWHKEKIELPMECPIIRKAITRMPLGYVSQYLDLRAGSDVIGDALKDISRAYQPNRLHRFLAKLPRLTEHGFLLIVTTAFDTTLESTFEQMGQPFDLISYVYTDQGGGFVLQKFRKQSRASSDSIVRSDEIYLIEPANLYTQDSNYPVILKLYGPTDWQGDEGKNFVITEDQYIDYLAGSHIESLMPAPILDKLRNSHLWFLGYNVSYWNLRVILHRIWPTEKYRSRKKWWAVQTNPGIFEQELWGRNNVEVIDTPLDDYVTDLAKQLEEVLRSQGVNYGSES